jgi:hypothetical protein
MGEKRKARTEGFRTAQNYLVLSLYNSEETKFEVNKESDASV